MLYSYKCCTKCVLDNNNTLITFDENGICNYCREYERKEHQVLPGGQPHSLEKIIHQVKAQRSSSGYDCIVGISGGLDSSYTLFLAKEYGLNPLAVHYDCGWNTENAVRNIENLTSKLNVDLYTYVVDWQEFRDVQLSYLKAGVVDLEIPTDHSFMAALYKTAAKFRTRFILTGHNFVTEGIMPASWVYNKGDATNLRSIHRRFGAIKKLRSFPVTNLTEKFYYYNVRRIANVHLLNYVSYIKSSATQILEEHTGWKQHPLKHGESTWTRFYQCYILPQRFGIDKRRAHLSNLICSGQLTRQQALHELTKPVYDPEMQRADMEFVRKKFALTSDEFDGLMQLPRSKHEDFRSEAVIKKAYHFFTRTTGLKKILKVSYHY